MGYAYTAKDPTDTLAGLPTDWDDDYDYPDVGYVAYPTSEYTGGAIPGIPFAPNFPVAIPTPVLTVACPATMDIATAACTVEMTLTTAGSPASAYVNHLIEVRAKKSGGAYTTLKLGNGSFQNAVWIKVRKYSTVPKYGASEQITFNLSGYVNTEDLVVEANVRTADASGSDTIDLTGASS